MKNVIELIFNFIVLTTITLFTVALMTGCGTAGTTFRAAPSCTVATTTTGASITCPDGTVTNISNGATGQTGANGSNGQNGSNGTNGSSCSVESVLACTQAPYGGAYVSCTDGTFALVLNGKPGATGATGATGQTGATGATGVAGTNGANGLNGTNGTNGTTVTPVQFCSQYTNKYPTTFPEVGFCMNNQIYAVYWDGKNAWLTEVAPGRYDSTSSDAPCSFTVAANCVVTP